MSTSQIPASPVSSICMQPAAEKLYLLVGVSALRTSRLSLSYFLSSGNYPICERSKIDHSEETPFLEPEDLQEGHGDEGPAWDLERDLDFPFS
jgi:hypothetical protein